MSKSELFTSNEEVYREALLAIRNLLRDDPTELRTAIAHIQGAYHAANHALMRPDETAGWQPIETVPQSKDLELLVYCSDTREQFVAYQPRLDGRWTYAKGVFGEVICRPTHWMPLPKSPGSPEEPSEPLGHSCKDDWKVGEMKDCALCTPEKASGDDHT